MVESANPRKRARIVYQTESGEWEEIFEGGQLVLELTLPIKAMSDELSKAVERDQRQRRREVRSKSDGGGLDLNRSSRGRGFRSPPFRECMMPAGPPR